MRTTTRFASVLALFIVIAFCPRLASAAWPTGGQAVCNAVEDQIYPAIASDQAGGTIVVWQDFRDATSNDIFIQRVDAGGNAVWAANGVLVCGATGDQTRPRVVSDGLGGGILFWEDARGGAKDIYAQRVNAAGVSQWTADGVAVCTENNSQDFHEVATDLAGGAVVVWLDHRESVNNPDIFAQRVDADGQLLWAAGGVPIAGGGGQRYALDVITDGSGGAFMTWTDTRSGDYDVFASRITGAGATPWTISGVAVSTAVSPRQDPSITTDGAGGILVAFRESDDIYAQRLDGSGGRLWTVSGAPVCQAAAVQMEPRIASDGAGGAIIAWQDNSSTFDIYAQRIDNTGSQQWTTNGIAISVATGIQRHVRIAPDGVGGAIMTWEDGRAGPVTTDIYAMRTDYDGTLHGTLNGTPICAAVHNQLLPIIASNGFGGATIAWYDLRSGQSYDIYVQQLTGAATGVDDTPAPIAGVLRNYPNPFNASTSITIQVPVATRDMQIEVFDVAGRRVRTLAGPSASATEQAIPFDGRDDAGRLLPSGVYFCRVVADGALLTRKITIAR
ncbi:MAG TPA: T9SS type A sorting domain-containing protein [Candidatus Krumholzibacteria bacterium]|nr:T9SS type A sorting domain-containing protein [Candidatus Krumholzibacteria bacterium]